MTPPLPLQQLTRWLEEELNHREIADWPTALNGLQVENRGHVTRIGAAVDGCEATLKLAVERGVDFLFVHHGLFWSGLQRVEGAAYRKLRLAIENNIAVYSSHLPLDIHPRLGNNAGLTAALGWETCEPFFSEKGSLIGLKTNLQLERETLAAQLSEAVGGPVKVIPGGPVQTRTIGVVTGGAGGDLFKAVAEGVDTFITGEGPHWSYSAAEEAGLNVLYAGHYATETFGVKAVAAELSARFGLPWEFLDHPTGL